MGDYRADLTGIQQLIDDTAKLETALDDAATELDKQIAALHVTWTGAAAATHRQAHDDRVAAMTEMQTALQELRNRLTTAASAYTTGANTATGRWP
jgi:WXG100 family type VII secretion target